MVVPAPPGPPDGEPALDPAEALRRRLVHLADTELAGYSPLYERIARGLATDDELLARLAPLGHPGRLPVLLLAAVHDQVLADPDQALAAIYRGDADQGAPGDPGDPGDPWPPFRALLHERFDEVAATMAARTVQTNEVGRVTALLPALAVAAAEVGSPLGLVEIGPSAGLNLLLDRYAYRYLGPDGAERARWGDPASPVQLSCTLVGPGEPPVEDGPPTIASRQGIDLAPVDVRDPRERRWLQACVWPDVPDRADRLAAALAVAAADPPVLVRGDALDLLTPVVDALPAGVVPCVVSTWALAYLTEDGRQAVHDQLGLLGRHRDLALVTAEYPHVTPWVPAPTRPAAGGVHERGATLVGLATWRAGVEHVRPLAWMQAHGRWLDWLG